MGKASPLDNSQVVKGHLADFETTTAHLLRSGQALALLNFAALFHEEIYITDTALGDSQLLVNSYEKDTAIGLFPQMSGLMQAGILKALMRDKVIVSGKQLFGTDPTIPEIAEGWHHRDRTIWKGQTGFTAKIKRPAYYFRDVQAMLERNTRAIHRYDPDVPKKAFRSKIREQLDSVSTLNKAVGRLPNVVRRRYKKATEDPWFTNAELWRILREHPENDQIIILHAHINQQCYAEITASGQFTQEHSNISLASFNLELQGCKPFVPSELHATLNRPQNLEELLEIAPVKLQSVGIEMLEKLAVADVVRLRRHAEPMFALAREVVSSLGEAESLRLRYLKAVENYWRFIIDSFEKAYPTKLLRLRTTAIFVEGQLGSLDEIRGAYGNGLFTILWRIAFAKAAALGPIAGPILNSLLGVLMIQDLRPPGNYELRAAVPPPAWYPEVEWSSRSVLSLFGPSLKAQIAPADTHPRPQEF